MYSTVLSYKIIKIGINTLKLLIYRQKVYMTPKGIGALENYNERRFEQDSLHLNRFHMR